MMTSPLTPHPTSLEIDGEHLSLELIHAVSYGRNFKLTLSEQAKNKIRESRKTVESIIQSGQVTYGINTGFGSLKDQQIDQLSLEKLQENLIRSHAAGVGDRFSEAEVRAAVLIRANSLARGYSGVRVELVEKLLEILNKDIYPYIPQQGSVGASGDLAPLSHLALVLMGEGQVIEGDRVLFTSQVFEKYNFAPLKLQAKEGLALNNGTAFLTAVAADNVYKAKEFVKWADRSLGLSLEALKGTLTAYDERIHQVRSHPGQVLVAKTIRELSEGTELLGPENAYSSVQDSYSLRCAPQVHGPVHDMIDYVARVVEVEINSVTDNPLIFVDTQQALSGGNFHGEPISLAMDCLAIALVELSNISERRSAKLIDAHHNNGLPPYLVGSKDAGLNSGFMILQYTAAAILAEIKVLAHPVVIDSIPTSANQEDYVSFGATASRKCRDIIKMAKNIIAIELICAAQGVDLRRPLKPGRGNVETYNEVRKIIPFMEADQVFHEYIKNMAEVIMPESKS
jgi:histidine ammonia-lyase